MSSKSFPAVAVFVKTPGFSPIKTRLAATWGEKRTLEFYEHCLRCSGQLIHTLRSSGWEACWAVADGLEDVRWREFPAISQGESDLGGRMDRVLRELRRSAPRAFVIGSDSPQLRPEHLDQAYGLLDHFDVVLGPAMDGGFWLLGTRVDIPEEVLDTVAYSGPRTRLELIRALRGWDPDLRITDSLPLIRDVDTEDDARALIPELSWGKAQEELAKWMGGLTTQP